MLLSPPDRPCRLEKAAIDKAMFAQLVECPAHSCLGAIDCSGDMSQTECLARRGAQPLQHGIWRAARGERTRRRSSAPSRRRRRRGAFRSGQACHHVGPAHRRPPLASSGCAIAQCSSASASASLSPPGWWPAARIAGITAALPVLPLPVAWRLIVPTWTRV